MKKIYSLLVLVMIVVTASAKLQGYELTVGSCDHGTVKFIVGDNENANYAEEGQTVTVIVEPEAGWSVGSIYGRWYTVSGQAKIPRYTPTKIGLLKDFELTKQSGADNTYSFVMGGANAQISVSYKRQGTEVDGNAEKTETGEKVDNVKITASVMDVDKQTVSIDNITVGLASNEGITLDIPATINGWQVAKVATSAMIHLNNVTDINMPDTKEAIEIEAGALPGFATIHTTLALLDDYALMPGLKQNYEATKVVCTVTPANKYWTLGTGCDVIIPDGVDVYTVRSKSTAEVATQIVPDNLLMRGNKQIVKANNGVLLLGEAGKSYDLFAYSGRLPSGMPITTVDKKDYDNMNCLEPVVVDKHFDRGHYFVLKDNEFHTILAEDISVVVPAGKAVLHIEGNLTGADARMLKIDSETTGISLPVSTD